MRILFMGTPDFAEESLKRLYESGKEIVGVVTNPDRQSGRGMNVVYSPVKEYALEKGLKIYQPEKISKNEEFKDEIRNLNVDLIVVVAYGKILPKSFLEIPKFGAINVHGSLLPKYRGAAPIQWAVLNGDKVTGITTMYMDAGMDTGDMILKEEVEIGEDETTGELWDRLKVIGADLLLKTIDLIEKGEAPREKQPEECTIAPMLSKEMAVIDWNNKVGNEIHNLVRGLNPIMGAMTKYNGKTIKFWKVKCFELDDFKSMINEDLEAYYIFETLNPGTIILASDKKGLFIKTVDNKVLSVLEIQGENAKRMPINDFLRGNRIENLSKFD